jgi:cell division protein FtsB
MAKIPSYKKDEETGAVIFQDATAYVQRKKVIASTKLKQKAEKDSKRSINSMKREIKDLKKLVYKLVEDSPAEAEAIAEEAKGEPTPAEGN